jgi:hypothetical protein
MTAWCCESPANLPLRAIKKAAGVSALSEMSAMMNTRSRLANLRRVFHPARQIDNSCCFWPICEYRLIEGGEPRERGRSARFLKGFG